MSLRRLVLFTLVAGALAPAAARAAVPVALYPVRVPGLSTPERNDVHGLLHAGLASGTRRGVLRPRTPVLLAAVCADPTAAGASTARCLARLAGDGVLLVARGEKRSGTVILAVALVDRFGARTREVRFVVDLVIENLRPVNDALAQLEGELDEDGTVTGGAKQLPPPEPQAPAAVAAVPRPPTTAPTRRAAPAEKPPAPRPVAGAGQVAPTAAKATAAVPLPPPPVLKNGKTATLAPTTATAAAPTPAAKPAPIDLSAPAESPVWKRQAGPFFTIVGGLALASGAAVALANRSLANDLNAKRSAGTLTAADRASYDKIDRYNVLSTVLLAGGGVSLAAGTWIWISAPARPGEPALAVAGGRF